MKNKTAFIIMSIAASILLILTVILAYNNNLKSETISKLDMANRLKDTIFTQIV